MEHDYADWRRVLATNLDSVFLLSQAAARHMATAGGGRIVSIASVLSFEGGVFVPGYATAKHGVVGLTRALANEWAARGINVNAVAPGYVATSNTAGAASRSRIVRRRSSRASRPAVSPSRTRSPAPSSISARRPPPMRTDRW